jgi:hypothetical protein
MVASLKRREKMTKLNTIETKTLNEVVKSGFTFKADAMFRSARQATTVINKLVKLGFLVHEENDFGGQWVATTDGREFQRWGF